MAVLRYIALARRLPKPHGPQRAKDGEGAVLFQERAAAGTLSRRSERLLGAYLEGSELHNDAPLFRNRSARPADYRPSESRPQRRIGRPSRRNFPI
jgi:hypothetical protein